MDKKAKTKRIIRAALVHIGVAAVLAVWLYFTGCPIYRLTGVPCPGCGMTRALMRLCVFDFASAWYYHPLVFFLPLPILYIAHRRAWKLPGNAKTSLIVAAVCLAVLIIVYIIRALTPNTFVSNAMHSSVFAALKRG